MADEEHLRVLRSGAREWNRWRALNPDITPDLRGAKLGWNLSQYKSASYSFIRAEVMAYEPRIDLACADLSNAQLDETELDGADIRGANLRGAVLDDASLGFALCSRTDFGGASLQNLVLAQADLTEANLTGVELDGINLADARVYGVSAWGTTGTPSRASNLIITPPGEAEVRVDDLNVAQFVHLLLTGPKIRDVIDTISKKGVLILGRFGEERIVLLNRLRDRLRELGWVPFVFDFDKPATRDFTETVKVLAGLSAFIVADLTAPRSTPHEAQAVIPDYMIPFVPIIQEGEKPYAMFQDLWAKHDWVLSPRRYRTPDELIDNLQSGVIAPAMELAHDLNLRRLDSIEEATVSITTV